MRLILAIKLMELTLIIYEPYFEVVLSFETPKDAARAQYAMFSEAGGRGLPSPVRSLTGSAYETD